MGDTAPVARTAVVARRAALMRPSQDRTPADGQNALASPAFGHRVPGMHLGAVELHRWQELTVRQVREALRLSAHSDEFLDVRIPGRDIRVPNRPVDRNVFLGVRFEVEIAPAVHLPPPHDRAAADVTAPDPGKRRLRIVAVGVLPIVHEELGRPLVARSGLRLNGLLAVQGTPIREPAIGEGIRRHVLGVVPGRDDGRSGFQHEGLQALFRQLLRRPPAGDAGADDDRVVRARRKLRPGHSHRIFQE